MLGRCAAEENGGVAVTAARGRVLLVDDEAFVRRAYSRLLRSSGFAVELLEDGTKVLPRLGDNDIDVVVTDLRMRGMDGIDVLRAVRASHPDVPVVLLTGSADLASAIEAMEHGALRYLTKPVDGETLARTVDEAVRLGRLARVQRQAYQLYVRSTLEETELAARLDSALRSLRMAFQPIVKGKDHSIYGFEALVRNGEPTLRRPDHLFAAAEQLGRLHELGRRIRRRVVELLPGAPPEALVFVNLHPRDLDDPDLYDAEAPLSQMAGRVVLEITERASLERVEDVPERIRALRALGFRIALDDLGSGYAGLTSFAKLTPDVIKLDMALVRGIDREPTKEKLVGSMVSLCHELEAVIVAEGIETEAERDTVVALGCDLLQGYLLGRPADPIA